MGALCSGKSENPNSLEPPRTNGKSPNNQVIGVPKGATSDKGFSGAASINDGQTVQSNGNLALVDTTPVKNIKVEEHFKGQSNLLGNLSEASTPVSKNEASDTLR